MFRSVFAHSSRQLICREFETNAKWSRPGGDFKRSFLDFVTGTIIGGGVVYGYMKHWNTTTNPTALRTADKMNRGVRKAVCVISGEAGISGVVNFSQVPAVGAPTKVEGQIEGLSEGLHGFHVHEWGDNTKGCVSAGPHYNPFGKVHGGPTDEDRHVGDLGNIEADKKGVAKIVIENDQIQLSGPRSVIGRTLVVHKLADDLGKGANDESLKTGNAGARIGCGIIGLAEPSWTNK